MADVQYGLSKGVKMKYLKFSLFYIISIFPLSVIYMISDIAFVVVYYIFRYRRKVVRLNLENSFPDKTLVEIIEIEKGFYKHFSDVAFESIKILTISKKSISKRFHIKNIELVEQIYKQKKDIILYTAHYGNWEWLSFLPLFIPHQGTTLYKELSNKYFDQLMKLIRCRFGTFCFDSNGGYKSIVKLKQENILSMNCIIGDQSPTKNASKHWVKFLNMETAFLIGVDRIAKKLNHTVLFPSFKKIKRGRYEIEFKLIGENNEQNKDHEIIDKYASILENTINEAPELWLWSHRRWKLTRSYN